MSEKDKKLNGLVDAKIDIRLSDYQESPGDKLLFVSISIEASDDLGDVIMKSCPTLENALNFISETLKSKVLSKNVDIYTHSDVKGNCETYYGSRS